MARKYSAFSNATNTTSTTVPMYDIKSAATFRLRIYDWLSGSDATPADAATKLAFQRTTTNGSPSAAVTANAIDPGDPASLAVYNTAWSTTNPTVTANSTILQVAQNQRATFRWVAAPDSELFAPATAVNGIALLSVVASATANYAWTTMWME